MSKRPADHFEDILGLFSLPVPEKEHKFHPERRWRFDYAWISHRIAVEIDGYGHQRNAHNDCEKRNAAQSMGWQVYVFNTRMLSSEPKRVAVGEFLESVLKETGDA